MNRLRASLLVCVFAAASCVEDSGAIDTRLSVHAIEPSATVSPEHVAYAAAIADIHAQADEAPPEQLVPTLRAGLAIPVPQRFPEAAALRLDLATRLADHWHRGLGQPMLAIEVLAPLLRSDVSLPLDAATARALVVLGDAAAARGDDALAAGSYARALRVLAMLREELER